MPYARHTKLHTRRCKRDEKGKIPTLKAQWDQILHGRLQHETERQQRAQRLGRDTSPMPGYADLR